MLRHTQSSRVHPDARDWAVQGLQSQSAQMLCTQGDVLARELTGPMPGTPEERCAPIHPYGEGLGQVAEPQLAVHPQPQPLCEPSSSTAQLSQTQLHLKVMEE